MNSHKYRLFFYIALLCCATSIKLNAAPPTELEQQVLPKASMEADWVIKLLSSVDGTRFSVDDTYVGTAGELKVLVDRKQAHRIIAEAPGYVTKDQFIQPEYNNTNSRISFTFSYTDKLEYLAKAEEENKSRDIPAITNNGGVVNIITGNKDSSVSASGNHTHTSTAPSKPYKPAESKPNRTDALREINAFADSICRTAEASGQSESALISRSIKAEFSGLLKKLANLDLEGSEKRESSQYQGVLQKDLAPLLSAGVGCRERIAGKLIDILVK